jgi:hypothetical protein
MSPASEPYLQIDSVRLELRLYGIDVSRNLRVGSYFILVENQWISIEVNEPYINTSGPPIRALYLYGHRREALQLLSLEEGFIRNGGNLFMKDELENKFEVVFEKAISKFYVSGEFVHQEFKEEFQCRFKFSKEKDIIGTAIEGKTRGKREIFVDELTIEDKLQLIHAVNGGVNVYIEKIPWI